MSETIRFTSPAVARTTRQVVYWKARWGDEWERVPALWCREAVWVMAPSLSTAQIVFRYGDTLEIGSRQFTQRVKSEPWRWYVRVDFYDFPLVNEDDDESLVRRWFGIIDMAIDEQFGPRLTANAGQVSAYPRGRDHFLAFGLESILTQSEIDSSWIREGDNVIARVGRALALNPGLADYNPDPAETTGEGNRSTSTGVGGTYVFHNRRTGGETWSTLNAVQYELAHSIARDADDEQQIEFYLDDAAGTLPDWDEPVVTRQGRTVWEVLNMLVPRQRGMTFRAEARLGDDNSTVRVAIVPCSMLSEPIELEGGHELVANENQITLAVERDRGADIQVRHIASETIDQIVVRGERRTSTATFSYEDGTLEIGWPNALETAYEQAASTAADYPSSAEIDQRADLNWFCRQADKFRPVYARHTLPAAFDGMVGDGLGGSQAPLMPDDEDNTETTPHAPDDQRFLPRTALLEGYAYDGDKIAAGNPTEFDSKPEQHLRPLVFFPRTNLDDADTKERYRHAEKGPPPNAEGGDMEANRNWTAHVKIDDDDGALWVHLSNGAQFLMAQTDFTRLTNAGEPADEDFVGDYRDMLATLTVPWSAFAEARYPEEAPQDVDFVRRKIILAPFHRLDYVAPQTVVAIDEKTGELLRTDSGGFVRDDRDKLKQIARLAFQWYGAIRKTVSFETSLVNNLLQLGDLIIAIGDPQILATAGGSPTGNISTVVTMVRIASQLGEDGQQPPPPTISYQTDFGELDVLGLVPRIRQR